MASNDRCGDYNQLISAYLDGEVTAAERTELLQHLATCASCRATMEQYRSIGTRIRGLPPVLCPDSLTGTIYAQTVDAPPRRLSLLTSRAGYPMAAVAAVLLVFVVAAFLLVDGYQRRIDPSIVGSEPAGEVASMYDPIRISFNKEMNRESVLNALKITPTSERNRLDITWDGNTLVIGEDIPLKPSTEYRIAFSSEAVDKWGNPLSAESFSLAFGTSDTVRPLDTAEAPTATVTPTATAEERAASKPSPSAVPSTATPEPDNQALNLPTPAFTPVAPSPQNETGSGGEESTDSTPRGNDEEPRPTEPPPAPTATPAPTETPLPTATSEPDPVETEEPTPVPPTPTETPAPEPTATPEPEPTAVPATPTAEPEPEPTQTQTPEPETVGVEGSFGNVYWSNDLVRERLGEPEEASVSGISARELDFQNGKMFQLGSGGVIYVMYTNGRWEFGPDTSTSELPEFTEGDQEGLWKPGGVLGYLWNANPHLQDPEEGLGQALEGQEHIFSTTYQKFAGGYMVSSADGFIYVIYDDNSWELYPDSGPLSDGEPTQVPSE